MAMAMTTEEIGRQTRSHSLAENSLIGLSLAEECQDDCEGSSSGCGSGSVPAPAPQPGSLSRSRGYRRTRSLYGASPSSHFGRNARLAKNQATILTIQDPGSQRLTWYTPPLSVLVIKKISDSSVIQPFKDLITYLTVDRNMMVYIEAKVVEEDLLKEDEEFLNMKHKICVFKEGYDDISEKVDLVTCLGGDGTLLYASSLFQQSVPPILAFHMGSLGFLTPFRFENFQEQINHVLEGNCYLTLRSRLKCSIMKDSDETNIRHLKNDKSKSTILVLNEVVVDRGPSSYICNIDVFIEKRLITSVQGDGIIISTPTGSTAYAAAAGASMCHPNVPAIIITPICPHSLSFRPIVVPAGVEIKISLSPESRNSAWVSFDGRNRSEILHGDSVRITTSIYPIPSICFQDQITDWFESLAGCLNWNVRKQQKRLDSSLPSHSSTSSLDSLVSEDNGSR